MTDSGISRNYMLWVTHSLANLLGGTGGGNYRPLPSFIGTSYEHPVVLPQVSHFMQVPLRTSVKLAHSLHISPS